MRTPFIAHHLSANSQKSAHPPAPDSNADTNQREDSSLDPTQCENPVEYNQSLDPSGAVSEAESSHLDLTNYDSVAYEMKDGVPGMKFTVDGSDGWTPVRKRRADLSPKCVLHLTQKAAAVTLMCRVLDWSSTVCVMVFLV